MVLHGIEPQVRELRRIGRHSVTATMSIDDTAVELAAKISAQAPQELPALLREVAPPLLPTETAGASLETSGDSLEELRNELHKEREAREAAESETARLRQQQQLVNEAIGHLRQRQLAKAAAGFEKAVALLQSEEARYDHRQPSRRPASVPSSACSGTSLERVASVPILIHTPRGAGGTRTPLSAAVPRGAEVISLAQWEHFPGSPSAHFSRVGVFGAATPAHLHHASSSGRPATSPAGRLAGGLGGSLSSSGNGNASSHGRGNHRIAASASSRPLRASASPVASPDLERTAASLLADNVWSDSRLGITPTPPHHSVVVAKVVASAERLQRSLASESAARAPRRPSSPKDFDEASSDDEEESSEEREQREARARLQALKTHVGEQVNALRQVQQQCAHMQRQAESHALELGRENEQLRRENTKRRQESTRLRWAMSRGQMALGKERSVLAFMSAAKSAGEQRADGMSERDLAEQEIAAFQTQVRPPHADACVSCC